jgi:hypothetical protein
VPGGVAVCGAEQRSLEGGARSALRELTCRILSERSERSERSELCGTPSRRAAQGSRCAAPTATVGDAAGHRLPRSARTVERRKQTVANFSNGPTAAEPPMLRKPAIPFRLDERLVSGCSGSAMKGRKGCFLHRSSSRQSAARFAKA